MTYGRSPRLGRDQEYPRARCVLARTEESRGDLGGAAAVFGDDAMSRQFYEPEPTIGQLCSEAEARRKATAERDALRAEVERLRAWKEMAREVLQAYRDSTPCCPWCNSARCGQPDFNCELSALLREGE